MKLINYCNKIIEYSFYALILLVPLVFSGATSELFEFPKMWLTFGLTIIIVTSWIAKMILQRRILIQRTPLDIPIVLFLFSQIISTIFSLDQHVSLWGYYSRFNGGLLSLISYLFLYYAFVSNLQKEQVYKTLKISLISGLFVALWGLLSHFGWDLTCLIFRGSLDTSCWTDAFKPTIRIFSTLGQPAWLAAYMSVLIPISIAYFLQDQELRIKNYANQNKLDLNSYFLILISLLFYACLTYTDTRGGFIGFWVANVIFWGGLSVSEGARLRAERDRGGGSIIQKMLEAVKNKTFLRYILIFNLIFLTFNFFQGVPISQINKFTYPEIIKNFNTKTISQNPKQVFAGALGGTDSGKIRLIVWKGAIDAWRAHPIIGTGVETFAFAYYKYKPVEHNLTSEWDYLYNKAHNEYLNYLTTTGIFGLGSYLAIIGTFLFISIKKFKVRALHFALIASYVSILISNFFGFSVVIINLYFFLIPAFVFILGDILNTEKILLFPNKELRIKSKESGNEKITLKQWYLIIPLTLTSFFLLLSLTTYWNADIAYALGNNLSNADEYQKALTQLQKAYIAKPDEPVYTDELSSNLATLAGAFYLQKDASTGAQLAENAINFNQKIINNHPNNIVYLKNRIRIFYALAQSDTKNEQKYYKEALIALDKARLLSPNDAKIAYNQGAIMGQKGDIKNAITILEKAIQLKPNYKDAYLALGLFMTQTGEKQKAIDAYQYVLKNIDPQDQKAKDNLKSLLQ